MSAYLTLLTPMVDRECLLAALVDVGFDPMKVEVHDVPVALVGFPLEAAGQKANIVIRKTHAGKAHCDVGFLETNMGYRLIVNDYDQASFGKEWLSQVHGRYQIHRLAKEERAAAAEKRRIEEERRNLVEAQRQAVYERAKKMGYSVKESREGEKIRLVLVQRTY